MVSLRVRDSEKTENQVERISFLQVVVKYPRQSSRFKEEPHYVEALQPPDVHHVVAALRDDAHDLHGSLRGGWSRGAE